MIEHEVNFSFKARYYKSGEITGATKQIWFVLHGYGQLAQHFIKKFTALQHQNVCVIAPEGLSRFYLDELRPPARKSSRVGAAWMTKENRETDIENYIQYLDHLYFKEVNDSTLPVTVLGFSQGSATASRWVMNDQIKFNRLVLWSGVFPPDMDFDLGSRLLHQKEVIVVYGKKDPYLTDERFADLHTLIKKLNKEVKEITFEGKHEIDEQTLLRLL